MATRTSWSPSAPLMCTTHSLCPLLSMLNVKRPRSPISTELHGLRDVVRSARSQQLSNEKSFASIGAPHWLSTWRDTPQSQSIGRMRDWAQDIGGVIVKLGGPRSHTLGQPALATAGSRATH